MFPVCAGKCTGKSLGAERKRENHDQDPQSDGQTVYAVPDMTASIMVTCGEMMCW